MSVEPLNLPYSTQPARLSAVLVQNMAQVAQIHHTWAAYMDDSSKPAHTLPPAQSLLSSWLLSNSHGSCALASIEPSRNRSWHSHARALTPATSLTPSPGVHIMAGFPHRGFTLRFAFFPWDCLDHAGCVPICARTSHFWHQCNAWRTTDKRGSVS